MEKTDKAIKIGKIVFKSIWSAAALFFWIGGFAGLFIANIADKKFVSWLCWGLLCSPFIIVYIIKIAKGQAHDSAKDGSRHYTYNVSTGVIKNHTFSGYISGFLVGLVLGVIVGPIAIPCFVIKNIADIIKTAIELKQAA